MKSFMVLASFCMCVAGNLNSQETKALFLGNSYTASNNLPQIVFEIALDMGDELVVDANTPGGYTLNGHTTNSTSLSKIEQGDWDFVILQEQSQMPAFPQGQFEDETLPFAIELNEHILEHNPCAETVFYMTWGRENGDSQNCPFWPPVCTYEGMDDLLAERYVTMAEETEGVVSPVGKVWRHIRENHPEIDLYSGDGSHPSAAGSYAAAVSFYVAMFRNNPEDITFDFSLASEDASIIRSAVKTVVYDNLSEWFIGDYDLTSNFEVIIHADTGDAELINQSENATDFVWTVNGQEFLTEDVYFEADYMEFTVTLTASNQCGSVTTEEMIFDFINSIEEVNSDDFIIYPNPTTDAIYFEHEAEDIRIIDGSGKEITLFTDRHTEIDLTFLEAGIYTITYELNGKTVSKQLIKR